MKLIRPTIDYMYIVNEAESRNGTMYYLQNKLILVRLYWRAYFLFFDKREKKC